MDEMKMPRKIAMRKVDVAGGVARESMKIAMGGGGRGLMAVGDGGFTQALKHSTLNTPNLRERGWRERERCTHNKSNAPWMNSQEIHPKPSQLYSINRALYI